MKVKDQLARLISRLDALQDEAKELVSDLEDIKSDFDDELRAAEEEGYERGCEEVAEK